MSDLLFALSLGLLLFWKPLALVVGLGLVGWVLGKKRGNGEGI